MEETLGRIKVSQKRSFSNEQIRMSLSLLFLILAAPIVIPSGSANGPLSYVGWGLFAIALILPLWSRFTFSSNR